MVFGAQDGQPGLFNKRYFQVMKVEGYSPVIPFSSPNYATPVESQEKVDFRSTLYWNPDVATDDKGEAIISYYAADLKTRYRIVLEGVTVSGKPFYAERIVEVID